VLAADRVLLALLTLAALLAAQDRRAPAGSRPANRQPVTSILPGGRILAPAGARYPTGLGAFGLAVSPSGKAFAAANGGPGENSITIVESDKSGRWQARRSRHARGRLARRLNGPGVCGRALHFRLRRQLRPN
jgi:hypothetical protein